MSNHVIDDGLCGMTNIMQIKKSRKDNEHEI